MTLIEFYHKLYDILQEHADAHDSWRDNFVYSFTTDLDTPMRCNEYRFQGSIGFGGKLYRDRYFGDERGVGVHRVGCYSEEESADNLAKIDKANEAIRGLEETYKKENME